jgi:hypothetical protein
MRVMFLPLAALALTVPPAAAGAAAPVVQTMTCPIGGASFDYEATVSLANSGERPDGKPYGSATAPPPLPECPDNGLVLYKDYDAEEVARLEPLVASEAYQALRLEDTQYYRAYWLMREMGLGPERYLWALLQATWEADGKPLLRARYQTELAAESAKVEPRPADLAWIGMEGRAINALRELGQFDEALARLDKVPLLGLDIDLPAEAGEARPAPDAATRRAWRSFFQGLRTVIARGDSSAEPFDMIPRRLALGRCIDRTDGLDEHQRAFCGRETAAVEEMRAARVKIEEEAAALSRPREDSGR